MIGDFSTSFWGTSSRQNPHPRLKDKDSVLKNFLPPQFFDTSIHTFSIYFLGIVLIMAHVNNISSFQPSYAETLQTN